MNTAVWAGTALSVAAASVTSLVGGDRSMETVIVREFIVIASRSADAAPPGRSRLRVIEGISRTGEASSQWLEIVRKRQPDDVYRLALRPKRMTDGERAWADLIQSRVEQWELETASLAANFDPIDEIDAAVIVIGNRGGEDAFTHDARTIGFDVSRLYHEYGDAKLPDNKDRIDRLFQHEYVHLLQKEWLMKSPYDAATPIQSALLEIWSEGLGNYYSLSTRWHSTNGEPSATARQALSTLEPRFAARIAALACAESEVAESLTKDLSTGPFDKKWGALPAALWLEMEARQSRDALRRFVSAGPDGVWILAERHLQPDLREVLTEARIAASLCRPRTPR